MVMRHLSAQLTSYLCRRATRPVNNVRSRRYSTSSYNERGFPDEREMEEEAERKIGWLFKLIFAGTATVIGYHIFPYLGDNLIQQSVSLLNVKDPLFKRMGASRLARFATDDEQRMKIVEMGGAQKIVEMLGDAKDDATRKEALNAIIALARADEAVGALHSAGAVSAIMATPESTEDVEIEKYKRKLLTRFRDMNYGESSS
ncbi:ARM repeat superfamily protein [Artemisia annua]|uniref:ARM repeat superfamily protein n=1 Tax=Artemisia annua TaxID=35608 RepID=A0A2U1PUV9_ARTAN|nr:ARM repeat superfamily protein [Artemisia annua]